MKGRQSASELSVLRDEATGAKVWQITSFRSINHATYFLQSSFTPDGRGMLFISNRSGSWQLFLVAGFPAGPLVQLTDAAPIHPFSPAVHPDGARVLFVRGGSLWTVELLTLQETLIADFGGASMGEPSLDAAGEWVVAAIKKDGKAGLALGKVDGTGWNVIEFPRTVIHPQFHPAEPEWIEFAGDPAPRMHRIRRDGTGLECLFLHDNDLFIVHETFLGQTGNVVYTVWPHRLCTMDWKTREHRTITEFNAWHIAPNRAGTRILCDTNHPDSGIYLIDVETGARRQVCLSRASNGGSQWKQSRYALAADFAAARSGAASAGTLSWMEAGGDTVYGPQWTHPHPSFSPDERMVVFASDRTGSTQVYAAEIPDPAG
jgi:hypothetical protein